MLIMLTLAHYLSDLQEGTLKLPCLLSYSLQLRNKKTIDFVSP